MLTFTLALGIALLITLTIHEAAHAWMANYLGDPTAKLMGRLSLNPLVHLDPMGTLVFIITALAGFPFGWGKPVVFDPYNLKDPRRDAALISLAGPVSNLIFASFLSLVFKLIPFSFIETLVFINIAIAVFNLIPIHPLDGGKILIALLPDHEAKQVDLFLNRYGIFILLIMILPLVGGNSLITSIVSPIINFFMKIFLPGQGIV